MISFIGNLGTGEIIISLLFVVVPFILVCWLIIALIRYLNRKSKWNHCHFPEGQPINLFRLSSFLVLVYEKWQDSILSVWNIVLNRVLFPFMIYARYLNFLSIFLPFTCGSIKVWIFSWMIVLSWKYWFGSKMVLRMSLTLPFASFRFNQNQTFESNNVFLIGRRPQMFDLLFW